MSDHTCALDFIEVMSFVDDLGHHFVYRCTRCGKFSAYCNNEWLPVDSSDAGAHSSVLTLTWENRGRPYLKQIYKNALDGYQIGARQTWKPIPNVPPIVYFTLGFSGEMGETVDWIKKMARDHGGDITPQIKQKLIFELGDAFWYLTNIATEIGVPLSLIAETNREKTRDRDNRGVINGSGDNR